MTGPGHADSHARFVEFVALMGTMMSLVALSIDAMLPALSQIGFDLGVTRANDNQLIVSVLLLGMAIGQLIMGRLPTVWDAGRLSLPALAFSSRAAWCRFLPRASPSCSLAA